MDMQYIRVNNLLRGKQLNILYRNTGLPSLYSRRVHAAEQNGRGDVIQLPTENIHVKCNERCRLHGGVPPVPHQQRIYYECLPRFDKKHKSVSRADENGETGARDRRLRLRNGPARLDFCADALAPVIWM